MTESESRKQGLGAKGFLVISDTSAHVGAFFAIKAVNADAVIDTVVEANGSTAAALTIDQGDTLYGVFTSIKLSSGKVIAYRR